MAAGAFVQHGTEGRELLPDALQSSCIMHAAVIATPPKQAKTNLAKLFFRGS
jgi:hypothetical protein